MSKIQEIKAWRYPCDGELCFAKATGELFVYSWSGIRKTRKELKEKSGCTCGKNCAPERIKITVERI